MPGKQENQPSLNYGPMFIRSEYNYKAQKLILTIFSISKKR